MGMTILRAGLLFLLMTVGAAGCVPAQKDIDLNPSIRYAGSILYIKNNDPFDYNEAKVDLNDGVYRFRVEDSIPAGKEIEINLLQFTKEDGERFNVLTHSIKDISISCKAIKRKDKFDMDYLGRGFYHGKFKN